MGGPLAYEFSCVPEAVAALTGDSPGAWAGRLARAGAMRTLGGASVGRTPYGTDVDRLADTLFRYGIETERWAGHGELLFAPDAHAGYLAALAHRRARMVNRHRIAPVRPELHPDPPAPVAPGPPRLNLGHWRQRFRRGSWLVVVETGPVSAHAVGLRDGRIVAGGQGHESRPVTVAFQLT